MKSHSEKQNPGSKPATKSLLRAGLDRAGSPQFADAPISSNNEYIPSDKFQGQSASLQRRGETQYADYLGKPTSDNRESTGTNWAGSKKGSR